jgi:hypothetical protein
MNWHVDHVLVLLLDGKSGEVVQSVPGALSLAAPVVLLHGHKLLPLVSGEVLH